MPGQMLWGWDKDNDKWVKLRLDADGSIHVVGYVDSLDDIGDVNVPTPADDEFLYWDEAASKWQSRTLVAGDIPAHKNTHDPNDGSDKLDTAIAVKVGNANAVGTSHSLARADHVHEKHHAKYLNAEAVSAVEAAGLALASGKNIKVIQALTANLTWSGITAMMTAGIGIVFGAACYVDSDGKLRYADADAATSMPVVCLATAGIDAAATGEVLLQGFFRWDDWDWTPGGLIYASLSVGALTQDVSGYTAGDQVQVVGVAITADIIYFNPSFELVEIS